MGPSDGEEAGSPAAGFSWSWAPLPMGSTLGRAWSGPRLEAGNHLSWHCSPPGGGTRRQEAELSQLAQGHWGAGCGAVCPSWQSSLHTPCPVDSVSTGRGLDSTQGPWRNKHTEGHSRGREQQQAQHPGCPVDNSPATAVAGRGGPGPGPRLLPTASWKGLVGMPREEVGRVAQVVLAQ